MKFSMIDTLYLALVAIAVLLLCGCREDADSTEPTVDQLVDRGAYLVKISGCHDCHSPKVFTDEGSMLDESRLLSGHPGELSLPSVDAAQIGPGKWILFNEHLTAAVGPWGATFAINLTSDEETGVGAWSETVFVNGMRTGKHMGAGRPILPPMPWFNLSEATDQDLKAIFAYLLTVPAVKNRVPDPIPPDELGLSPAPGSADLEAAP